MEDGRTILRHCSSRSSAEDKIGEETTRREICAVFFPFLSFHRGKKKIADEYANESSLLDPWPVSNNLLLDAAWLSDIKFEIY